MEPIVDTNVTLFQWPFRRIPGDIPAELVKKLRSNGVVEAWAGTFEGVFHRDVNAANERLAEACREHGDGLLIPFGSINPTLPDWESDLKRCVERLKMPGIRLHPNYHRFTLKEESVDRLMSLAQKSQIIVQIVATMEDERTQPYFAQFPHVDCKPVIGLAKKYPQLKIVLLNAFRSIPITQVGEYLAAGEVWVDLAMLESIGGVGKLIAQVGSERILFGSHFPLFYFESALFKMKESHLGQTQRDQILNGNARRILPRTA